MINFLRKEYFERFSLQRQTPRIQLNLATMSRPIPLISNWESASNYIYYIIVLPVPRVHKLNCTLRFCLCKLNLSKYPFCKKLIIIHNNNLYNYSQDPMIMKRPLLCSHLPAFSAAPQMLNFIYYIVISLPCYLSYTHCMDLRKQGRIVNRGPFF